MQYGDAVAAAIKTVLAVVLSLAVLLCQFGTAGTWLATFRRKR